MAPSRRSHPILTQLSNAGDALWKSLDVLLTYPFVDEVVGRDPQVARNLHMGDFTNLSVKLDLDLTKPLLPGPGMPQPCTCSRRPSLDPLPTCPTSAPASATRSRCAPTTRRPRTAPAARRPQRASATNCRSPPVRRSSGAAGNGPPGADPPGPVACSPDLGSASAACCAGARARAGRRPGPRADDRPAVRAYDPALVAMLVPGLVVPVPRGGSAVITRRTKIQLVIFVIITLVGCLLRRRPLRPARPLRHRPAYTVTAHFPDSGGVFAGAEVTYRGVAVGRVDRLELTDDGVDVDLEIDNGDDDIPADAMAVVGNRSAVGEQYVELQPQSDDRPYLKEAPRSPGGHPDPDPYRPAALRHLHHGLLGRPGGPADHRRRGREAFDGTGEDLQPIIDSGNSFIETANDNFDVTTALIEKSNTLLNGQIESDSALRTFASQLSVFSEAFANSDGDLRQVIDTGSFTATQLRDFLETNKVDLGELIRNLAITGEIVIQKRLPGIAQLLVVYPYVVEGSFSVVSKTPATGLYDAHFGLILNTTTPCYDGYPPRTSAVRSSATTSRWTRMPGATRELRRSTPRGEQNIPPRAPATYDAPVVASYDPTTSKLTWGDPSTLSSAGSVAPRSLGEESWKWLYLSP